MQAHTFKGILIHLDYYAYSVSRQQLDDKIKISNKLSIIFV